MRPFLAFSKIVGIMPCKGDRKKFPLTFDKSASCPWRASEKKFSKIPTYSGLRGVVRNEGEFLQINVHFPFCWFVGISERNIAVVLAKSPLAALPGRDHQGARHRLCHRHACIHTLAIILDSLNLRLKKMISF